MKRRRKVFVWGNPSREYCRQPRQPRQQEFEERSVFDNDERAEHAKGKDDREA